ncbi:MAG TPA: 6-phosphogluconolactonase [Spirochaetales bacterium]|nr:6-phosphogluconolactonase [Spirochaetales bacterium]
MIETRRFDDEAAWIGAVLADAAGAVQEAEAEGRRAVLCLAGGRTPEPAYRAVAAWLAARARGPGRPARPVLLVPGDERLEPRGPSDLNDTMLRRAFAPALDLGAAELAAWNVSAGERAAVAAMAALVASIASGLPSAAPLFDRCYLGLGADGHVAGVFPGSPAARRAGSRSAPIAVAGTAPEEPRARVSLSLPTLASTRGTRFIVRAAGKEDALRRLASGDPACPAVAAAAEGALAFVLARQARP